jgi:hypothetical protein
LKNAEALKYEALKNTERLSTQLSVSSCEAKYEALKNTQALQAQLAECCCEIKEKVSNVQSKIDDTLQTLDSQRIRDALNVANNEINLLRATRHFDRGYGFGGCGYERRCGRSHSRSRSPRRN